ncbi:UNVERIFIED_CONTAM: hypothetical protein Sangu_0809600 [Sesamum angustifolium]|uniref:Uncharacterized protein n=1 Tax=Sesamum angustifolium TaxID=2727405 RepID=A0AAW2PVT0_9LAMI
MSPSYFRSLRFRCAPEDPFHRLLSTGYAAKRERKYQNLRTVLLQALENHFGVGELLVQRKNAMRTKARRSACIAVFLPSSPSVFHRMDWA